MNMKAEKFETGIREIWMMYYTSFFLGWTQMLKGIEFFRCVENFWIFYALKHKLKGSKVLDIGPWKSPLPVFMSHRYKSDVTVLDVEEGIKQQMYYAALLFQNITPSRIPLFSKQDEVNFELDDATFDVVTCVSTLEHFEGDLDKKIVNEIHRVLKPSGFLFITVPYGQLYHESMHYIWTEKRHNTESLSNLFDKDFNIVEQFYFKDEETLKFTKKYWSLNRTLRLILGRFWIFPAIHYLKRDSANQGNASLTGLVLQKK